MWTPATALLWECWRLSRRLLAILIFIELLVSAMLLVAWLVVPAQKQPPDLQMGPTYALLFAVMAGIVGGTWAINVDRRRGFQLALGFARPIRTWVLVSVPLAYIGVSCAVIYLVPMLTLRAVFDIPFPLFPMAGLVSTLALVLVAIVWMTDDPIRQRVVSVVLWLVGWFWYFDRLPPGGYGSAGLAALSFSAAAYGAMALVAVAVIGLSIVGVARQRRGDDRITLTWSLAGRMKARSGPNRTGLSLRCPVSSPTRAQLWFEMSTAGIAVLKSGLLTALLAPPALALAVPPGDPFFFGTLAFIIPPVVAFRSMLGIQRKVGVVFLGAFAATRAMGTARLVGLKVLVTSLCVLASWALIGTSLWICAVRLDIWGPDVAAVVASVFSLPAYAWIGAVVAVVTAMAGGLALHALLVLDARRVFVSAMGLAFAVALSIVAGAMAWIEPDTIQFAYVWIVTGAALLGSAVLLGRLAAERIFSSRSVIVVLAIWVGIALVIPDRAAWLHLSCLPLAAAALAPWSYSRLRHP